MSKTRVNSNSMDSDDNVVSGARKRLEDLLKQAGNDICADCGSPDPKWVSINIGVFICIKCSGVHRSLGVHISKVVSVNLDEWTDELVDELIQMGGNDAANKKYEAYIPEGFKKPNLQSGTEDRHDFIRKKYELQQFSRTDMSVPCSSPRDQTNSDPTKKQDDHVHGHGIRQALRNSWKKKEVEQTVPKKSNSLAGMVEFVGLLKVNVVRGTNLAIRDLLRMTSDPYVVLSMGEQTLRTNIVKNNLNPVWNQSLMLSIPENIPPLKLVVYDKDTFSSDDFMGEAEIDIEPLFSATKANQNSKQDESRQYEEQIEMEDIIGPTKGLILKSHEKLKQVISVKLKNVEKGVVDIELEIVPLSQ